MYHIPIYEMALPIDIEVNYFGTVRDTNFDDSNRLNRGEKERRERKTNRRCRYCSIVFSKEEHMSHVGTVRDIDTNFDF